MTIYEVQELMTEDLLKDNTIENASGLYSSMEKAQKAILARIAEEYTDEEIARMNIAEGDWDILEVPENEWVAGCTYIISSYELDTKIE